MVMKLYGIYSLNVQRAILPLFEAGVDAEKELELVKVNLLAGDHAQPTYTAKQPFGLVPFFEDGDVTVFESRAIAKYLTEKYQGQASPLLGKTLKERAAVNQWIESEAQNFQPAIAPMVREIFYARALKRPVNEEIVTPCVVPFNMVLDVYEAHLSKAGTKYLAGDKYTLADAFHIPYLNWVQVYRPDFLEHRPRVSAWVDDIISRPAFQKCRQLDWESATVLQ